MTTKTIQTACGAAQASVSSEAGRPVQVNVFWCPAGPPFFLVFPEGGEAAAIAAAASLIERGELPEQTDITKEVPGALAAGTGSCPRVTAEPASGAGSWCSMEFGTPEVKHAEVGA